MDRVVFDISDHAHGQLTGWMTLALIAGLCLLMVWLLTAGKPPAIKVGVRVTVSLLCAALLLPAGLRYSAAEREAAELARRLDLGQAPAVRGPVGRVQLTDPGHHRAEWFEVAGRRFQYSVASFGQPYFRGERRDGCLMEAGEPVTVFFDGDRILRIVSHEDRRGGCDRARGAHRRL